MCVHIYIYTFCIYIYTHVYLTPKRFLEFAPPQPSAALLEPGGGAFFCFGASEVQAYTLPDIDRTGAVKGICYGLLQDDILSTPEWL